MGENIEEVSSLAEQKTTKKKTSAKTDGKKPSGSKKQTTQVAQGKTRFGDTIIDEIILLLIVLISVVALISVLTDKMGIIGGLFSAVCKGLFGFGGLLLPLFVICYCIWFLVDQERKWPVARALGAVLFLSCVACAAHLINPIQVSETASGMERMSMYYHQGTLGNGGFIGGLLGGLLHSVLDTLGSVIILLALMVISVVMSTGKSLLYAIGNLMERGKVKKKIRNERIKNKAEEIRQMELAEEGRAARYKAKVKKKQDFNIELEEAVPAEAPVVEATLFPKRKLKERVPAKPIFDFVVDAENDMLKAKEEIPVMVHAQPMSDAELDLDKMAEIEEIPIILADSGSAMNTGTYAVEKLPFGEEELIGDLDDAFDEGVADDVPLSAMDEVYAEEPKADEVTAEEEKAAEEEFTPAEPAEEEIPYRYPPIDLLGEDPKMGIGGDSKAEMLANAKKLESTLKSFGVEAKVIQINKGPTVTRYELSPSQGVKVSKIVNLADDIALNLAASGIRIEAPIPGKAAVGIEVPNAETQSVYLRTVLESDTFKNHASKVAFALGEDIAGNPMVTDIAKMPHLLIAGATGSGKSVCINTLITSILYKADPKEVKLLLVDPKVVELSVYNGVPHLLIPVVTDPKKAASALKWAVREMLERYNDFAAHGVRDIKGFNAMMDENGDEKGKMPQIVIIIDELADLMMAAPGEVEDSICRLAQMARAAGMHLIIATQRPSVDVITGVIKANIPSRLAFAVSSGIDSRTILDMVGAEKLIGKGDMLFYPTGQNKPSRLQGAFVTDAEVESIVSFLKKTGRPQYTQETIDKITSAAQSNGGGEDEDEFFEDAVELIIAKEKASVSMLQRQFRIGYNRAARLMDDLERRGMVGPEEGSKPRRVLLTQTEWENMHIVPTEKED